VKPLLSSGWIFLAQSARQQLDFSSRKRSSVVEFFLAQALVSG
jgi:hypothetical protein